MKTIKSIKETTFNQGDWSGYDGYVIDLGDEELKLGISNGQACCENWGYLMSEDNLDEFIGAKLISVERVDEGLNKKCIDASESLDCGSAVFINLNTSNGTLQFVAYNSHNGYYGHTAVAIGFGLNVEERV